MSLILALGAGVHLLCGAAKASSSLSDEGTFVLSLAGQEVGTENFRIRKTRDGIEAEAQIEIRVEREGKAHKFRTSPNLVLNNDLQPERYTWSQKGEQSSRLEVDFRSSPARVHYKTVAGQDDVRDFDLPKDVVVLDDNVFHHFQLVLARCRKISGTKHELRAFVPQEALPGVLTVEDLGKEENEMGQGGQKLRHHVVTTELARIDVWADDDGRVQRISIPAAQLEAVRR